MTFDGRIEARFTVPASTTISVTNNGGGPTTVTLTAGTYYLTTLVAHLQTILTAQRAPSAGAWSVTLSTGSSGTGKVTIAMSAGTFSITWSSTTLRDLLGFDANISSEASSTGANQARGLWIPDCPPASDIPDHGQAPRVTDRHSTSGPTGIVISHTGNLKYRHPGWRYSHVERKRVWKGEEVIVNQSWERFLEDVAWGQGLSWFDGSALCQVYDLNGALVGVRANSGSGLAGWYLVGKGINSIIPKPTDEAKQWNGRWRIDEFDLESSG